MRDSGEVREAELGDREALALAMARAFLDDPVAQWAIPPDRLRESVLIRFYREFLRQHERHNTVWCDEDRSGAALWSPPGKAKMGVIDTISLLTRVAHPRLWLRGPLLGWGALSVERLQPKGGRFFYLAALGVDPVRQGEGIGSRLIAPALAICDEDRVGAYLESSRPENVDFYSRHGFRVVGEKRLPRGPLLPLMYREPA